VRIGLRLLLIPTIRRLPAYAALAWRVLRDPRVSRRHKVVLAAGAGYVLSPIDLLPGFIPVIGQMDDLAVMLLSLRATLRLAPPEVAESHLAAAGLSWAQIDDDLSRLVQAGSLITAVAVRLGARAAVGAGRLGARAATGAGRFISGMVRRRRGQS
jgi:uncharacterized membrane protein YkvA (DUF1232 family)